jgi:glutamate decarboxylase
MEEEGVTHSKSDAINERLSEIFSGWGVLSPQQTRLRDRVLASYDDLIASSNVCTDLTSETLYQGFIDTIIPEEPCEPEVYGDFLTNTVVCHSINMSSPRCLGHMSGVSPSFVRSLSELVVAMNQNLVKRESSKVVALIERQILATFHRLIFQMPEAFYHHRLGDNNSTLGIMTSGGTLANLTALWCARNAAFPPQGDFQGVEEDGIANALNHYDYDKAVIVGPELMHYSIEKAAAVLGIGAQNVIKVPVDENSRMDLNALESAVKHCKKQRWRVVAIVGVAGTTDCGTIDRLTGIGDIASRENIHFHVDAAWGAPLMLSQVHRNKLQGIERADSVTLDGHKQLYLPIGIGMLLLRDPLAAKVLEKQAHYILQEDSADLGKFSLEGSRPAMALFAHAALNLIGRKGYEYMLDESIRKAKAMARDIQESGEFELLVEPETNIVLYRYVPINGYSKKFTKQHKLAHEYINSLNQTIQLEQYKAGRTFVSRTTLNHLPKYAGQSVVALRAVVTNPLTSDLDIKAVLQDQVEIGRAIELRTTANAPYKLKETEFN